MAHYYLNKIGISSKDFSIFNPKGLGFSGRRQRRKHSFPLREVYNLDYTSATWLYEHLMLYKEYASTIIVLDDPSLTFDIPVLHLLPNEECEYYHNDKRFPQKIHKEVIETHTQLESIEIILKYLQVFLKEDEEINGLSELKKWDFLRCAFKIYSVIIGSMWV